MGIHDTSWHHCINVCMCAQLHMHFTCACVCLCVHPFLKVSQSVCISTVKQQCCRGAWGPRTAKRDPDYKEGKCGGQCTRSYEVPKWEVQWLQPLCASATLSQPCQAVRKQQSLGAATKHSPLVPCGLCVFPRRDALARWARQDSQ